MSSLHRWGSSSVVMEFGEFPEVAVLWDYTIEQVVGEGHVPTLFDTLWTYTYRQGSKLPWVLCRFPGDVFYKHEDEVPELVRLAVMVAS